MVAEMPSPEEWTGDLAVELPRYYDAGHDASFWRYTSGDWTVIEAVGEIDVAVSPTMLESLDAVSTGKLVFDLSRVTFMDASGLAVLAAATRRGMSTGCAVRVAGPSMRLRRLLTMTGFDDVLEMYESVDEAIR